MIKKISVFTLLLSLMLAFVAPMQARAEEDKNYFEYNGTQYVYDSAIIEKVNAGYDVIIFEQHHYGNYSIANREEFRVLVYDGSLYDLGVVQNEDSYYLALFDENTCSMSNVAIQYYCMSLDLDSGSYYWPPTSQHLAGEGESVVVEVHSSVYTYAYQGYNYTITPKGILYSSADVYQCDFVDSSTLSNIDKTDVVYKSDSVYSFKKWCSDAGLSCSASSNESSTVIPYSYSDYWHIVRKTSAGKWLLTTIGNSMNQEDMDLIISDDGSELQIYNLYSGDTETSDVNGYYANVRQYVYDTDGWRLLSFTTYDARDTDDCIIELGSDSWLDDTKVLAYTSVDIQNWSFETVYPVTTEYTEPTDTTPTPTPTPTTAPSDDSSSSGLSGGRPGAGTRPSDVGGTATGGAGLDFIINLFTLIWTKICSVPMAVDGYSISLQQIIIYGALVSIVGGFIIKFIFGRR